MNEALYEQGSRGCHITEIFIVHLWHIYAYILFLVTILLNYNINTFKLEY